MIVEAAMVLPLLITFMLGILELGFGIRQGNVVERAVSAATRTDTQLANSRNADFEALRTIGSILNSLKSTTVTRVVVYNPNGSGNMSAACDALPATGSAQGSSAAGAECNVYSASQVAQSNPAVGFPGTIGSNTCPAAAWDHYYCPLTRNPGTSAVGIRLEVQYTTLTRLYGSTMTFERQAYYVTEPVSIGS